MTATARLERLGERNVRQHLVVGTRADGVGEGGASRDQGLVRELDVVARRRADRHDRGRRTGAHRCRRRLEGVDGVGPAAPLGDGRQRHDLGCLEAQPASVRHDDQAHARGTTSAPRRSCRAAPRRRRPRRSQPRGEERGCDDPRATPRGRPDRGGADGPGRPARIEPLGAAGARNATRSAPPTPSWRETATHGGGAAHQLAPRTSSQRPKGTRDRTAVRFGSSAALSTRS